MLVSAWPLATGYLLFSRYMGWEAVSLFHLAPSAPPPVAFQRAGVVAPEGACAARSWSMPTFGLAPSR